MFRVGDMIALCMGQACDSIEEKINGCTSVLCLKDARWRL